MPRGRFITIEGGEGAGKSTQAELLVAALRRAGIAAERTREPGGSPGAEAIRRLLLEGAGERWDAISEALLLYAARRDHVMRLIAPALASGTWVVSDRFAEFDVGLPGLWPRPAVRRIAALQRFALGDFMPDLTLILDLPVAQGLARAARRSGCRPFRAARRRVPRAVARTAIRAIAAAEPERCVLIDAAGDRESVHRAVLASQSPSASASRFSP